MKTIKILSIISLLLLVSCGQKTNSDNLNEEPATMTDEEIYELERLQALNFISEQYDATITFDTVQYRMTYQYQDLLSQNDRVVIEGFRINDIEELDSIYIVSIEKRHPRRMFIEFICNQNQIEKLDSETDYTHRFLILKINTIKKLKFKIDSYVDDYDTYLELDVPYSFTCKAEFIDIYYK